MNKPTRVIEWGLNIGWWGFGSSTNHSDSEKWGLKDSDIYTIKKYLSMFS